MREQEVGAEFLVVGLEVVVSDENASHETEVELERSSRGSEERIFFKKLQERAPISGA